MNKQVRVPKTVLGIIGGGQLGMMTAEAAKRLGIETVVWAEKPGEPGTQVASRSIVGSFDDSDTLDEFLNAVTHVTVEFENVPLDLLRAIEQYLPVRPSSAVIRIAQDRRLEKDFLSSIGVPVTPTTPIADIRELREARGLVSFPAILKTARLGYDGKGQVSVSSATEIVAGWRELDEVSCVLEERVDFAYEMSVIVARDMMGVITTYTPIENVHREGILRKSCCPGPNISDAASTEGTRIAIKIAQEIDLVGILAVEMFVTKDDRVLVNELAPRPHNSGHGTIEACVTSQFEQHVRTICGMRLGPTALTRGWIMENLIGDEVLTVDRILRADPRACIHHYMKREVRPGRKMGHVTSLFQLPQA